MFDGSVSWSVGVGGGERSWRALGAPKRLWPDGFVVIVGVFVVAVGVSAEEGGEWPRGGGGGRCADARPDGRLEFFGARQVVGCALADAGLDGFFKGVFGERWGVLVYGAGPRGHVDGGTERIVRNREGVERVGGVRPKYWVPRERIRT